MIQSNSKPLIPINSYLKNEACKSAKLQIICSRRLRSIRPTCSSVSYNLHRINASTLFEVSHILTFKVGLPVSAQGIFLIFFDRISLVFQRLQHV